MKIDKMVSRANQLPVRNSRGFSMPTILTIGVISGLWLIGTYQLLNSSSQRVTIERTQDIMRASAEAGLDWAVQQLNDPSARSTIDGQTVNIPSSILNNTNLTGTVSVVNTSAPTTSYLYDPQCDSTNASNNIIGGNGWRVITSSVNVGGKTKQVRVILKPVYAQNVVLTTTPTTVTTLGAPQPIFSMSMFAQGTIAGHIKTNSYLSSETVFTTHGNGDVGSNGDINKGTQSEINGDVTAHGTISGGGTVTGSQTSGAAVAQLPQTPTAPATATNLGAISVSGNNTYTIATPGDYIISSLSIAGNGRFNVTANGPVNLYVQGSSGSNPISIAGNGMSNSSGIPGNLRLWYGGSGNVSVAGNADFKGVVYAPNASVAVSGNGKVYGAVVANTINNNGNAAKYFYYDETLGTGSSLTWTPTITTTGSTTTSTTTNNIDYYQAVSWMEFTSGFGSANTQL